MTGAERDVWHALERQRRAAAEVARQRVSDMLSPSPSDLAFDEIAAAWDETVACQSQRCRGCRNPVAWIVVHHAGPCSFPRQQIVCTYHLNRWRRRLYLDLYLYGHILHSGCGRKFTSIEQFGRIVRL